MIIVGKFYFSKIESDSSNLGLALGYSEQAKTLLQSILQTYSRSLDKEMGKIVEEYRAENEKLYHQYMKEVLIYVCIMIG